MGYVLPPEHDPAMDDQPCPDCKGPVWDCEWWECDQCEDGVREESGDPMWDQDLDQWGNHLVPCDKCDGVGGWCTKSGPDSETSSTLEPSA